MSPNKPSSARNESDDASKRVRFEDAIAELAEIVRQLEDGDMGLDDSLVAYEAGVRHLRRCHELLENAEKKIQMLQSVDRDGNPEFTSFTDEEQTLEEKAESRSKRRSSPTKAKGPTKRSASKKIFRETCCCQAS